MMSGESIDRARAIFQEIGCAQLSDAFQKASSIDRNALLVFPGIMCRTPGLKLAGPAFPVNTHNDMLPALQALHAAPEGHVLFVHNRAESSEALAGDIFVKDAKNARLGGLVVDGAVRDLDDVRRLDFPVFSRSVNFVSAKTAEKPAAEVPEPVRLGSSVVKPGDWVFGDNDGLLVVEARFVSALMHGAQLVEEMERALKGRLDAGERLGDVCRLSEFLEGTAPLRFEI